ncbi:ABC transporter A family protein [Cavenderia fasciculata]|uniref:ABC transporter A family protein n=1 Tax=Cavenderia fasciculata TaxID=261658 RepID=F4PG50_CACFS|nr:ABC transporter A family protein [Cavenderia fasciculata]EGG24684.1 ABC transporter A family protein [Cavenderia fasciculata]|eukprot:XP_004362535.1 ABC transporter A family protein [Cavenderia fasciculata]
MESIIQFKVLAKKNLLLKSKSKCGICCEIVFPLVIIGLLFAILGIIQSLKSDFDNIQIQPLSEQLGTRRLIIYGPSPLGTEQEGVLQLVISNLAAENGQSTINQTSAQFIAFPDIDSMNVFFANNSDAVLSGVWFNSTGPSTPTSPFSYSLRMDSDNLPATDSSYDRNSDAKQYTTSGFLSVQAAFDQAILQYFGVFENISSTVSTQRFTDPYNSGWQSWNTGRDAIYKNAGSVFITASLFLFAFRLVTELVSEKEIKIREGMAMMGMKELPYCLSWLVTSLIIALPVTVAIAAILRGSQIIYHTGWGSVMLLFMLYILSLMMVGFVASSRFAGLITYCIVLIFSIIGIFVAKADFSKYAKLLLCLFPPIAMASASYSMAVKDLVDVMQLPPGIYLTDVDEIIGMLILDIVLYTLLYWYLRNVISGEFGTSKPLLFFLKKSYWVSSTDKNSGFDIESYHNDNQDIESIPVGLRTNATVSIRNLRKEFQTGNGIRTAVDGLHLEMYPNQIHAFLGHNGAGKSTTIGMLTGLIPATGGDAMVNGYSIQNQMDSVRRTLGVCPQHDIIWKQLTVYEHLCIYAGLKGVPSRDIAKEAIRMTKDVGLEEKMNAPSDTLSGGQKRKLCLGIAFIGRSSVIFLDEVTSGMDPLSRRGVWDFLLRNKQSRTIVLTTHFMDEADFLGDRIAIITHGKLRCDGSSLFLKKRFGVGYLLTISKHANCQSSAVIDFIKKYIPEAVVLSDVGTELSLRLPTSSAAQFVPLFRDMDHQKDSTLAIDHYGISITTMEEVFLRIGQESGDGGRQFDITTNQNRNEEAVRRALSANAGILSSVQQLRGLLIKRILTTKKDLKAFFLSIVIPLAVIGGSIGILRGMPNQSFFNDVTVPMTYSMSSFGPLNTVPVQTVNNDISALAWSPYFSNLTLLPSGTVNIGDYLESNFENSAGALNFSEPILIPTLAADTAPLAYTIYYNRGYLHSSPTHMNLVNDAILRNHTNGVGIQFGNMPFTHVMNTFEAAFSNSNINAIIYFALIFAAGYSMMSASFGANMCVERVTNIKRLLYISGCKKAIYWLSNMLWDYSISLVVILVVSGALAGIESAFKTGFGIIFLGQCLYILSSVPLAYLLSHRFQTNGRAIGGIFGIFIGVAFIMMVAGMNVRIQAIVNQSEGIQLGADIMDYIFYAFSPVYCLARVMMITLQFPGTQRIGTFGPIDNLWTMDYVGTPMIYMLAHAVLWTTWILVLDYMPEIKGKFRNPKNASSPAPPEDEDSDVTAERTRVNQTNNLSRSRGNVPTNVQDRDSTGSNSSSARLFDPSKPSYGGAGQDDVVVIKNIHKLFPGHKKNPAKTAVHNTCLAIPRGQTFGLLGLNGAGKTTTLSMLSGDTHPTSGAASINGYDLITERSNALSSIGSCPQFDALVPLLSGREQLTLYCRIKGIPEHQIPGTVDAFVSMMDLGGISDSNVGGYSGGNKRKVSLSIAMLGNPSVVFLDEASTGCDPQVRRFMWNIITELGKNKVIIITTHSMEECEALCQRISIMKDGKLMCLGSNQHIKSKFGSGYSIDIKLKKEYVDTGVDTILRAFPGSSLLDRHDLIANFELPSPNQQVWQLFDVIQQQLSHIVDDYSVSQTSLEQVFLKLTASTYEQRLNQLSESGVADPSNIMTPIHS